MHIYLGLGLVVLAGCGGTVAVESVESSSPGGSGGAGGGVETTVLGPVALASGQARPRGIALDAGHVYWANEGTWPSYLDGAVAAVPKAGGDVVVLAAAQPGASGIAVDATLVFWSNGHYAEGDGEGTVMRRPLAGGAAETLASGLPSLGAPLAVAIDDSRLFVTAYDTLLAISKQGGPPKLLATLWGPNQPFGIALDAEHVYLASGVTSLAKDGTEPQMFSAYANSYGVAVDATAVYATSDGYVYRHEFDGSTETPLLGEGELSLGAGVAVDDASIYWLERGTGQDGVADGRVLKVAKTGGVPIVLASGQHDPCSIAVDEMSVYWTSSGSATGSDGSVMRADKRGPVE